MSNKEKYYYELNGKQVEARDFKVYFRDGTDEVWTQGPDKQYMWAVGMTGELNIQEAIFHTKFAAKISESRIRCYAHEVWGVVEVLDDEE
jgi:hypothetical protein